MRVLVTGVTGFAGSWLAEALLESGGCEVAGLSQSGRWPGYARHLAGRVALFGADLCRPGAVEEVLRSFQPRHIYHLAGYANVGQSFKEPDAAWQGNLTATRTLFDAVLRWGGRPRILAVSSAMVYGNPGAAGEVFTEESPLRPVSPYATSKAAADLLAFQVAASDGLDVVRVRPFNHLGPRQSDEYAVAHFARQLAGIRRGVRPPLLETGDLSAERDFTDVRDVARAYLLLIEHGRAGEVYNVASGVSRPIRSVLDELIRLSGTRPEVRVRADLLRRTEPTRMLVRIDKLRAETGWRPRHSLEDTLRDTLDYWSSAE